MDILGVAGRYRFIKRHPQTLEKLYVSPWTENIITDIGLDKLGGESNGTPTACFVGTGTGTPSTTDTQLGTLLAVSSSVQGNTQGLDTSTSTYYSWVKRTYRFNEGDAAGTLTEVGVGSGATALFSRARIKDSGGSDSSITVLANEVLDVIYEFRVYAENTYTSSVSDITIAGIDYSWKLQPRIDQYSALSALGANSFRGHSLAPGQAYTGSLPANINGSVSGAVSAKGSRGAYSLGSHKVKQTVIVDKNKGNGQDLKTFGWPSPGGVSTSSGALGWALELTPAIQKDSTLSVDFTVEISWARASI